MIDDKTKDRQQKYNPSLTFCVNIVSWELCVMQDPNKRMKCTISVFSLRHDPIYIFVTTDTDYLFSVSKSSIFNPFIISSNSLSIASSPDESVVVVLATDGAIAASKAACPT